MAYTNTFNTATPVGTDAPNVIDNKIRETKAVIEERLGDQFYGVTNGETDDAKNGVKVLPFRAQTAPATNATAIQVYGKLINSVLELFFKDSAGNEKQITSGGVLLIDRSVVPTKTGTADSDVADKLSDSTAAFVAADVGSIVHNTTDDTYAIVTARDSATLLSLDADIFPIGNEAYEVIPMPTEDEELVPKVYVDRGFKETSQVRATKSADQSIGGDATTKITFDTETFDTLGNFADSKFTAKIKGAYQIGVGIYYYGSQGTKNGLNSTITNNDTIHIYKNGVNLYSIPALRLGAAEYRYFEFNQIANLVVGDYIEIYISRLSSAAVTAVKSGVGGSVLNIQRIS